MTTSWLASIEYKPQYRQQLYGGKQIWSNEKLYMTFATKLYFNVGMVYILDIMYPVNFLFMFLLGVIYPETVRCF